jgi:hypothetical protein
MRPCGPRSGGAITACISPFALQSSNGTAFPSGAWVTARCTRTSRVRGEDLRALGRHLEYLYSLRRRADYDLAPEGAWEVKLRDAAAASILTIEAERLAHTVPEVDFAPIVHLF